MGRNPAPSNLVTAPPQRQDSKYRLLRSTTVIPILFVCTVVGAVLMSMIESERVATHHIKYTTVTGFFYQDEPATDPSDFDYTKSFGLIDRSDPGDAKTKWEKFADQIKLLNSESDGNIQYKVLFFGRHGQGYHNVAETFYGTALWDSYWSWLPGNGTSDWSDAKLTPIGIAQAGLASDTWRTQHTDHAMPMPQSYYSSPLERCLQTANHTFSLLVPFMLPSNPFALNIKELFREVIGVHTCDRRSTKTEIEEMWKEKELDLHFEEGFKEKDERWEQEWRETNAGIDRRSVQVLDKVFDSDKNTWISITCHSGVISSMLRVLNHREFSLQTGGVIPVLVKAETVVGPRVPIKGDDFEKLTMGPAPTLVTA